MFRLSYFCLSLNIKVYIWKRPTHELVEIVIDELNTLIYQLPFPANVSSVHFPYKNKGFYQIVDLYKIKKTTVFAFLLFTPRDTEKTIKQIVRYN